MKLCTLLIVFVASCKPGPPDITFCAPGCTALKAAGCFLGAESSCVRILEQAAASHNSTSKATGKPLTCKEVAAIKTTANARRIGFSCQAL